MRGANVKRRTTAALESKKAKLYDRVTTRLYDMHVCVHGFEPGNGKRLGDCTRADLLRAAILLPGFCYRELADLVGNGTVRQSGNTEEIMLLILRSAAVNVDMMG
jgi:hypothetical protein